MEALTEEALTEEALPHLRWTLGWDGYNHHTACYCSHPGNHGPAEGPLVLDREERR